MKNSWSTVKSDETESEIRAGISQKHKVIQKICIYAATVHL